jgi:hypothetical protein
MTWKELAERIERMSEENKDKDLSILLLESDEVIPISDFVDDWKDDDDGQWTLQVSGILDEGNPYLVGV